MRSRTRKTGQIAVPNEESVPRTPTRSRSASSRPNYKIDTEGLDIDEADSASDGEYNEVEVEAEEEEVVVNCDDAPEEEEEDDEESAYKPQPRRGRPPKRPLEKSYFATDDSGSERSRSGSVTSTFANKKQHLSNEPIIVTVVNEEYDLPEDPEGEVKISANGDLLDDRKFKVRTFTIIDKEERKFMLATEPARAVGLRDSHLFFQQHPNLYRYVPTQGQKNDMIDRGLIPYSYKSRLIALVTARSVFREFGAKIIEDGQETVDDYYISISRPTRRIIDTSTSRDHPKRLSKRGMEGLDLSAINNDINPARNAVEFFDRRQQMYPSSSSNTASGNTLNATNWLYQHAAACSRLNSDMYYDRVRVLLIEQQGLRDPYTNVLHLPQSTQSTKVMDWYKILNSDDITNSSTVIYETKIASDDLTRTKTGLADIPLEAFDGLVSEEIKQAILEQQKYENK